MKLHKVNRTHVSYVELERDGRTPIGLSIKDGPKYGLRPLIKNIKAQSLSHRSHCVGEGDVLLSLCGEDSRGLSKKEVRRRLKAAGTRIDITLQYESKEPSFDNFGVYRYERITLRLRKECGSFGFILRKNDTSDSASSEYPTITNIRPGGPADKEKCLQDGDRLLKIDDQSLSWLSLSEVSNILKDKQEAAFLIEYNVRIVDFCTNVGVQNEVHIDCLDDLGMILGSATEGTKLQIQEIRQGSLAQRCGVFKQGDIIERINDIDTALLTSSKANNILQHFRKESGTLVFIPYHGGQGLLQRLNPNVLESVENKNPPLSQVFQTYHYSKKYTPSNTSTEIKQSSSTDLPHNGPSSSKATNFPANHCSLHIPKNQYRGNHSSTDTPSSLTTPDPYGQTISMLTDVVRNVSKLGYFVSYFDNEAGRIDKTNTPESHVKSLPQDNCIKVSPAILSQLKSVYTETKKSTYDLALHVTKHHKIFPWDIGGSSDLQLSNGQSDNISISNLKPQVVDGLLELERRNILKKANVVNLKSRLVTMEIHCKRCSDFCVSMFYLVQKIKLLSSFNGLDLNSQEICSLVQEVENIRTICKDCSRIEHQAESEITVHNHPASPQNYHTFKETSVLCGEQNSSKQKIGLNKLSNTPDTQQSNPSNNPDRLSFVTQTNISNSELPVDKSSRDLNIKVGDSVSNPTIPKKHLYCKAKNESKDHLSNWVNYFKNSKRKVHKEKNCFEMSMRSSRSEEALSSDENLDTPDLESSCSNVSNSSSTRVKRSVSSSNIVASGACNELLSEFPRSTRRPLQLTSTSEKWETTSECFSSASFKSVSDRESLLTSSREEVTLTTQAATVVKLKDEGFGFGLEFEHCNTSESGSLRTVVTGLDPLGAAKKCGIIREGDRILEVNGLNLVGLPDGLLDSIFEKSLKGKELSLKVEFDIATPEIKEGIFDVLLEKTVKCGLVFEEGDSLSLEPRTIPEIQKGAPLIVRGIVAGSAAHRSGLLHPGDKVLSVRSIKEESYEAVSGSYKRLDWIVVTVSRSLHSLSASENGSEGTRSSTPSVPYVVHRSTVRSTKKGRVIDHAITLFRDEKSDTDKFGFGIKQNPCTGNVYVSEMRKGGPADASKVMQVEDRILEVNGTIIGRNNKSYVIKKFKEDKDFIDLITRRILE